jgi:hypothetical protein
VSSKPILGHGFCAFFFIKDAGWLWAGGEVVSDIWLSEPL